MLIAIATISGQSFFSTAASYRRTSLQDMTKTAFAVAEVTVLKRSYPTMDANEFQRTYVEVSVQKTLKGALPETITLDLPGGLRDGKVYFVADSAEFQIGERAMVFIKDPTQGRHMMQDLGLGKFNIVERNGQTFVESALCPKAMETTDGNAAADVLTKSIPYSDFCTMVSSYATNETPAVSPIKLAMTLPLSGSHVCDPTKTCVAAVDAALLHDAAQRSNETWSLALGFAFMAICAGMVVTMRRRATQSATARASMKSVALVMTAALIAGATLGGSYSMAYNLSGPKWNLDDVNNPNKIQSGKVVVKYSTHGSKTNANCFTQVQAAFDKWASIANCRLDFAYTGTTSSLTHSSNDNVNFVAWDANPSSDFTSNTLGITYSVYTIGSISNYVDCDIIFNDRDFSWAQGAAGNINSVAIHEIGHFIGLNHTNTSTSVMYPIDRGFTQLSSDEIAAAIVMYPGQNTHVNSGGTAPSAMVSGSPLSGAAPLSSGFDASASIAGSSAIASYTWNFGDGSTGSGAMTNHTFLTAGTFTVSVTVTDATNLSSGASLIVTVTGGGSSGESSAVKGAFKLPFKTFGKDTFSTTLVSQDLANYNPGSDIVDGVVTVAGMQFTFSYDPISHKAYGAGGMKMVVNPKFGTISIRLTNADLKSAFDACGAINDTTFGTAVNIPVSVVFGDGSQLSLASQVNFTYYAVAGKTGSGKF